MNKFPIILIIFLIQIGTNISYAKDELIPWGEFIIGKYVGSTTPSYLDMTGDLPLRYKIELSLNFPIYYKYLFFGTGLLSEANDYQFVQQQGRFWLASQITKSFSVYLVHHSSHNFDSMMKHSTVPFPTTDAIELHWSFGIDPRR